MSISPFRTENLQTLLHAKKILLGVTGSIAAFKACDLVRFLKNCGAEVQVVLTAGAENFVTPLTLETLSGRAVLRNFWEKERAAVDEGMDVGIAASAAARAGVGTFHIETARWADLILIAPASANVIAKLAHAMADDLLTTEVLAFRGPVLIAPAMNPTMYANPGVQENLAKLRSRGVRLVGPIEGPTACGELGLGRMMEPEDIIESVTEAFVSVKLSRRALISLGPTRSALDPVRFITNRSSGLMGASLCWAAHQAGFEVTAVCGPVEIELPQGVRRINVDTCREMAAAVESLWGKTDLFVSTAAVLDWEIANFSSVKLKKETGTPNPVFEKSPDILAWACKNRRPGQLIIGFAAETDDPLPQGIEKLKRKGCDAIFVNDVSRPDAGFETQTNAGWWVTSDLKSTVIPKTSKSKVAHRIISEILLLWKLAQKEGRLQ